MVNSTSRGPYRFIGAFGAVALLSALGAVSARQNSLQLAHAMGSALRGAPRMTPRPEEVPRPAEAGVENQYNPSEPWASSQVERPADLAKELSDPKNKKPLIICVGFRPLYEKAHIPGALFHGPAASPDGLQDLRKWAQNVSRGHPIVLYCGCCPWDRCPNMRPAFKLLREMGFTRLKVLSIETDFGSDWVEKGFPIQKGG